MPFELGIDYGCRQYFGNGRDKKKFLILEEKQYQTKQALSDLAGCDLEAHDGHFDQAIRKVRNWLVSETGITNAKGAAYIIGAYTDFQAWHYERMLDKGFSAKDIQDIPTVELLEAIKEWVDIGKPI